MSVYVHPMYMDVIFGLHVHSNLGGFVVGMKKVMSIVGCGCFILIEPH